MVRGAASKIDPFNDPAIRGFFNPKDPEVVYADFREIGHGGFGSVYYVSIAWCPAVLAWHYSCVHEKFLFAVDSQWNRRVFVLQV